MKKMSRGRGVEKRERRRRMIDVQGGGLVRHRLYHGGNVINGRATTDPATRARAVGFTKGLVEQCTCTGLTVRSPTETADPACLLAISLHHTGQSSIMYASCPSLAKPHHAAKGKDPIIAIETDLNHHYDPSHSTEELLQSIERSTRTRARLSLVQLLQGSRPLSREELRGRSAINPRLRRQLTVPQPDGAMAAPTSTLTLVRAVRPRVRVA